MEAAETRKVDGREPQTRSLHIIPFVATCQTLIACQFSSQAPMKEQQPVLAPINPAALTHFWFS